MKIPGEAYLQFESLPAPDGTVCLRSTALFRPRGLGGRLYWWVPLPIHQVIFRGLNAAIRERAACEATIVHFNRLTVSSDSLTRR